MGHLGTLKRSEVFLGLRDADLDLIAGLPSCSEETYGAQETVFREGEEAKNLYVVEQGQIELVMAVPSDSQQPAGQAVVNIITKGGSFGWSALVPPYILTSTAICNQPCKLLVISWAELRALFDREPRIGYEVMKAVLRIVASRLRNTRQLMISGKRSPFIGKRETS